MISKQAIITVLLASEQTYLMKIIKVRIIEGTKIIMFFRCSKCIEDDTIRSRCDNASNCIIAECAASIEQHKSSRRDNIFEKWQCNEPAIKDGF